MKRRTLLAIGILSFSILAAQSPKRQQSSDPISLKENESDTPPFMVYLSADPKPIPLERESIVLRKGTDTQKGEVYITIPQERSSLRSLANPIFNVKGRTRFIMDDSHPVVISRLKTSGSVREYRVKDMFENEIACHYGQDGIRPVEPLDRASIWSQFN